MTTLLMLLDEGSGAAGLPAWSMICFILGIGLFLLGSFWGWRAAPENNPWPGRWSDLGFFLLVLSIALRVVVKV